MPKPSRIRAAFAIATWLIALCSPPSTGGPLQVDFSRADEGGSQPLQAGWEGFGLPATGGEEVTIAFPHDELAGPGRAVAVTVAGNSHTRDYAPATGPYADLSALLSDGPLLNRPGVITLSIGNLLDGTYHLTTYHHTTQFGISERGPATPFDIQLSDADGMNRTVASGLTVSDNSSPSLTTHLCEFIVAGGNEVHLDFIRGPDLGAADHFALAGFSLQISGPLPPPRVLGEVLLNEFMASNQDVHFDGDGQARDWIEIWNATSSILDLGGWFLTDDPLNLTKWPFPAIALEPDAYLVVFASGQTTPDYLDAGGNHHTNFRIDRAAGGYLALVQVTGPGVVEIVGEFADYPAQREDISYGFHGDSAPLATGYFPSPTPGRENSTAVAGFVADTRFSQDRGLHDAPFHVTISTTTPGATIRYTTDGSAPTPSNGRDYPGDPGLAIDTTTTLRAAAFLEGYEPTNIDTQTYLFPSHVPNQPGTPPGFPTTWTGWDYEMDQDPESLRAIVDRPGASVPEAKSLIAEALRSLPTMSVVMDLDDLFGTASGIYHNTQGRGMAWERPCSIELIDPAVGGLLQIDCGIRIQGFTSRNPASNPKHSLRLAFRKIYGAGKLRYPVFGPDAANEFDTLVLRSNSQDAWVYDQPGNRAGQFVRDEWNRQTQLAMGRPSPRGHWVHLYLNGLYWGIYNPVERPDASFMASYFGGEKDDQDSLKNHEEVIDGNGQAYAGLLALIQNDPNNFNAGYRDFADDRAYQRIQGNQPNGDPDPRFPDYLDVPNLIDYLIHNMYSAATDWPGNNYIGRDRTAASTGFKFFSWDNEHGMKGPLNENRTLPHSRDRDSPTKFHHPLRSNAEYRLLFADHLHRAFFNDGPLTAENAAARWREITAEIEQALIAESARWGDYRRVDPYTVEGDFKPLRQSLLRTWFPRRSRIVLDQFRAQDLYPKLAAPSFSQHGGSVPAGHALGVSAPEGAIYATLDGSDPRLPGGSPNPFATMIDSGTITLNTSGPVKARTLLDGEWSALNGATFIAGTPADATNLVISELLYKPLGGGTLEFIELVNIAATQIELTGVHIRAGIAFDFPVGFVLGPGQRTLIVDNRAAFEAEFGGGLEIAGEFTGDLDNNGETLTLAAYDGSIMRTFRYDDKFPWPESADTAGYSITLIAPDTNPDHSDPSSWRSSVQPGGSPGASDADSFTGDPAADVDRDGRPALLEHALGTSDLKADRRASFELVLTADGGMSISFTQSLAADDVQLTIETSTNLDTWSPAPSEWTIARRENLADGTDLVTIIASNASALRQGFLRLRVESRD